MKNTKFTLIGLSLLLGAGVLAGCGTTSEASDSTNSSSNKTKIDFWTGFGTGVAPVLEGLVAEFEAANPTLDVVHESQGGYDNLQKAISLSASTGSYPHLAVGYPDHMAGYIVSNMVQPLDTYIEAEGAAFLDDFLPAYLKENQTLAYKRTGPGGAINLDDPYTMGLPFNKSTEVVVANKAYLEFFAAKDPTIVMPQSWEQLEVVGGKMVNLIKTLGAEGKIIKKDYTIVNPVTDVYDVADVLLDLTAVKTGEFRPFSWDSTSNMFITLVRQWGAEYTRMGSSIRKGEYLFNDATNQPIVKKMLALFKKMYDAGIVGLPATWGESQFSSNPFNANKIAMTVSSSAGVRNNVPPANKFKISINPMLYHLDELSVAHKTVISQGTNLIMFQKGNDEVKQAVWNLIKFLTTGVNDRFAIGAAYYPVTYTMASSTTYQEFLNQNTASMVPGDVAVIDAANVNAGIYTNDDEGWTKFVDAAFVGSSDIRAEIGNVFGILFAGDGATGHTTDVQREAWAVEVLRRVVQNLKNYAPAA